jgi:purine-cytosine permease-like protein
MARARIITAILTMILEISLAIYGQENFLLIYTNFITVLLYVLVPWTAINLVDYYLVAHGEYEVESFLNAMAESTVILIPRLFSVIYWESPGGAVYVDGDLQRTCCAVIWRR